MTDKEKIEQYLKTHAVEKLPTRAATNYKGTAFKTFVPHWTPPEQSAR